MKEESTPKFSIGDYVILSTIDTPFIVQLFGSESKVLKNHLGSILLELFMILGSKSTVEFEFKNGNKGRAITVPWVKNEESFQRPAKNKVERKLLRPFFRQKLCCTMDGISP